MELGLDWDAPPYPPAAESGRPPSAAVDFEMGDVIQETRAISFLARARQCLVVKDSTGAAADLRRALAVAPDLPEANNDLAWLLLTGQQELSDPK